MEAFRPGAYPVGGLSPLASLPGSSFSQPYSPCEPGYSLQYVGAQLMCVPDADMNPDLLARVAALRQAGQGQRSAAGFGVIPTGPTGGFPAPGPGFPA
mgnify:FL=1